MRTAWHLLVLLALPVIFSACQREHVLSGWGGSGGTLVWDKTYDYAAVTDARVIFRAALPAW